jgi:hypothetical protein
LKKPASRPSRPVRVLTGAELEAYCAAASSLVLAGRLSRCYPDPERCAAYLRALAPSFRGDYEPEAAVDLMSGLPTLKELVSVQADAELAEGHLKDLAGRPEGRALSATAQAKADYYERLARAPIQSLVGLEVSLRRIDPERRCAAFEVVFDRYDPAETVFTRYTILLEQEDRLLDSGFLSRRGDYSKQTDAFRDKMERYTQDDSELAFLLLGQVQGLRVEEVTRARVGPFWSPCAPPPPECRAEGDAPGYVLHFPLDRASLSLPADRNDDPFSTIYRDFLSAESRPLVEEQAKLLGYRVHKDRKFAATGPAAAALRRRLEQSGMRNIIYEI